jgi:hypothetical protein
MPNLSPAELVIAGAVGALLCLLIIFFLASGLSVQKMGAALRSDWRLFRDPEYAAKVQALLAPPPPAAAPKPSGAPLRLLALLQREGRLLDFLLEDIQAYPDPQISAAVRDIHRQCQTALKEHLVLEPVFRQSEGASVEVPVGFDPSAVRVTGNVTGQPPFRGTLQHHGWRVREIKLAPPPEGQDEFILMPAEVELA